MSVTGRSGLGAERDELLAVPPSPATPLMGAHAAARPRRRRRLGLWVTVAGVLVAALVATVVTLAGSDGTRTGDDTLVEPPATGANVMVLPLSPVGGRTASGAVQTEETAAADVRRAADFGAAGVRVTADLSWLCPTRVCTTAPLEPLVEQARSLDLTVYLHVNSTPSWIDDRGTWFGPEGEGAEEWAGLFAQMVERFGTQIAGYEVWNEPNIVEAWAQGPDPEAYAALLKEVWTAAKAVDPEVQLIGGVLSNNDLGYMHALDEALVALGGNA